MDEVKGTGTAYSMAVAGAFFTGGDMLDNVRLSGKKRLSRERR